LQFQTQFKSTKNSQPRSVSEAIDATCLLAYGLVDLTQTRRVSEEFRVKNTGNFSPRSRVGLPIPIKSTDRYASG
ncbi:MAG: hypothetical protein ABGZ53_03890, partial [Fuerstiella sp.]